MKYLILSFLFLSNCTPSKPTGLPVIKYSYGQEVKVTSGFYKNLILSIEDYRYSYCGEGNTISNYIQRIMYKGSIYASNVGRTDVEVCDDILIPIEDGK